MPLMEWHCLFVLYFVSDSHRSLDDQRNNAAVGGCILLRLWSQGMLLSVDALCVFDDEYHCRCLAEHIHFEDRNEIILPES